MIVIMAISVPSYFQFIALILQDCKIYLCGTKKDKLQSQEASRATEYHDIVNYAGFIKAKIFETSSKTGENVGEF